MQLYVSRSCRFAIGQKDAATIQGEFDIDTGFRSVEHDAAFQDRSGERGRVSPDLASAGRGGLFRELGQITPKHHIHAGVEMNRIAVAWEAEQQIFRIDPVAWSNPAPCLPIYRALQQHARLLRAHVRPQVNRLRLRAPIWRRLCRHTAWRRAYRHGWNC